MVMKKEIGEPRKKIPIPEPPYFQQGSGVTLIYTLPAHRFNDILPGFFETYPNRKKVWFAVDVFKWDKSISKHDPEVNHPFNEIIYRVYVKFNGRLGDYTIRAYLNNPVAVNWGRHFYAYPKYLADVSINKTPITLLARGLRDGQEILNLEVTKRGFISGLLSPLFNAYINRLIKRYAGPYNFREEENEVVNVPVTMKNKLSIGKVKQAYFRDPIEWDILSEKEALKPSYVFLWESIDMNVDPPEITKNP